MNVTLQTDDREHPVPEELRSLFAQISDAFVKGDYALNCTTIEGVTAGGQETAQYIKDCVEAYGDALAPLDHATWERSCYGWADGHWEALVDMTTQRQPVSDLTLHADIRLDPLLVTVRSVHVP